MMFGLMMISSSEDRSPTARPATAPAVLKRRQKMESTITGKFADREAQFWESGLTIVDYDRVSEIGLRSTGLDLIPRRYCIARVRLNNGAVSTVSYNIAEDLGTIGFGFNVVWCVEGLDREMSFGPACKTARP